MADVEIKGRISIDTGTAGKSISDLNKEIGQSKKALHDAKIGSDEYVAASKQLAAQQQQLKSVTDAANQSHSQSGQAFGVLKDKVTALVPGLKGVEAGSNTVGQAFKVLAMNPIVLVLTAIVAILKFLYEAFTSTREGAEKVMAIFDGVSAAVQVVVDRVMKLGQAIIKFFSGDFKGAVADVKGAVSGIGDEIEHAYTRTVELKQKLNAIKKEEMADALDKSVRQKRLAQLREMMNDEDVAATQKLKIAKELRDDAIKNSADDLERTRRKIAAEIELITMKANWEKDHLEEVNNLKIELNNVETDNALEVVRVNKQVKAAQRQIDAEAKAAHDEEVARQKEAAQKAKEHAAEMKKIYDERVKAFKQFNESMAKGRLKEAEDTKAYGDKLIKDEIEAERKEKERLARNEKTKLQNLKKVAELDALNNPNSIEFKIAKMKADLALELNALEEGDLQRQILTKKHEDAVVAIHKEAADAKDKIAKIEHEAERSRISETADLLGKAADVVGRQTAVGKGLAIAQSLINTYQGITAALTAKSTLPSPFDVAAKIVNAVAIGATGFKAVKAIGAVAIPGGGGGGASAPSAASVVTPPLTPQAQSTSLNRASINGIGNAAQGGTGRVFVLDADVSNAAERTRRINRAARLG